VLEKDGSIREEFEARGAGVVVGISARGVLPSVFAKHMLKESRLIFNLLVANLAGQGVHRFLFGFFGAKAFRREEFVYQLHLSVSLRVGAFSKRVLVPCFFDRVFPGFGAL